MSEPQGSLEDEKRRRPEGLREAPSQSTPLAHWLSRFLSPERRKRLLMVALLLLPMAILTLLFKEIARTIVLLPIKYLAWLVGVLWRSIPQELIWGIIVIAALRVAVGSLITRRRRPEVQIHPEQAERWGRARIWTRWVELAGQGGYFQRRLSRYLSDLTVDALAQREHLSREQVQEELPAGRLDLPPRIQAFLLTVLNEPPPARFAWLREIWNRRAAPSYPSPGEIVDFLEARPGVRYGH